MKKTEVIKILESNPYFEEFHKEFNGKFVLRYTIHNIDIIFYNTVGCFVEAWLTMSYNSYAYNQDVRDFIDIAKKILQQKINSDDAYNPM